MDDAVILEHLRKLADQQGRIIDLLDGLNVRMDALEAEAQK